MALFNTFQQPTSAPALLSKVRLALLSSSSAPLMIWTTTMNATRPSFDGHFRFLTVYWKRFDCVRDWVASESLLKKDIRSYMYVYRFSSSFNYLWVPFRGENSSSGWWTPSLRSDHVSESYWAQALFALRGFAEFEMKEVAFITRMWSNFHHISFMRLQLWRLVAYFCFSFRFEQWISSRKKDGAFIASDSREQYSWTISLRSLANSPSRTWNVYPRV